MTILSEETKGKPPVLLAGGLDPSGRAGILADAVAVNAAGAAPMAVATALTVQNAREGFDYFPVEADIVERQLGALALETQFKVMKVGMAGSYDLARTLAGFAVVNKINVVYDPVLTSTSCLKLADEETLSGIKAYLIPAAYVVTPNADEAEALTGRRVRNATDVDGAAKALYELGARNVLITGGHLDTHKKMCVDYLYNGDELKEFVSARIPGEGARGTGCVTASVISAALALGRPLDDAVVLAKESAVRRIVDES